MSQKQRGADDVLSALLAQAGADGRAISFWHKELPKLRIRLTDKQRQQRTTTKLTGSNEVANGNLASNFGARRKTRCLCNGHKKMKVFQFLPLVIMDKIISCNTIRCMNGR